MDRFRFLYRDADDAGGVSDEEKPDEETLEERPAEEALEDEPIEPSEVSEGEEEQEKSSQDEETPDKSDDEFTEDFGQFKGQYKLPDDIDSMESLASYAENAFENVLPEMKRRQTDSDKLNKINDLMKLHGYDGGVDSLLNAPSNTGQSRPMENQSQPANRLTVEATLRGKVRNGEISEDMIDYLMPIAKEVDIDNYQRDRILDQAFGAIFEKLRYLEGANRKVNSVQRDNSYGEFAKTFQKGGVGVVSKAELDAVMDKYPGLSYTQAQALQLTSDPKSAIKFFGNLKKSATQTAKKKLRFKGKGHTERAHGRTSGVTYNHLNYLLPSGEFDEVKMRKLSDKARDLVMASFEKTLS
jgi:hypothetical protein